MTAPTAPAQGWYPDPSGDHALRFWDGSDWTDQVRAEATTVTSSPAASDAPAPQSPALEPETAPPGGKRRRVLVAGIAIGAIVAVIVVIFAVRALTSDDDGGGGAGIVGGGGSDALGTIETPEGTFTIEKVQVGTEVPGGCDFENDPGCLAAEPGSKIVKVTLGGDEAPDGLLDDADVFIESADGDRSPIVIVGFETGDDGTSTDYIGFTPDESDRDFTLHWGRQSVELGK